MVNYLTKIGVLNLWEFDTQNHAWFLMPLSSCLNFILAVAKSNGLVFEIVDLLMESMGYAKPGVTVGEAVPVYAIPKHNCNTPKLVAFLHHDFSWF